MTGRYEISSERWAMIEAIVSPPQLSPDRHTAVPTGSHATATPPLLRAFTRLAHHRPYGLTRDWHTTAPTGFHKPG